MVGNRRARTLIWTLLLLSGLAKASSESPGPSKDMLAVAEAVEQGNAGDREGAIRALTRVLRVSPDLIDARVGRGVNRYLVDDFGGAKEDLDFAFSKQAWEEVHYVRQGINDVTKTTHRLDLIELRRTGAAMLVVIDARAGNLDHAKENARRAEEVFGPLPLVQAAVARLLLALEDPKAWDTLLAALEQPDPTLFIQSVASEMVAADPTGAPASVHDKLAAAGQWTAHYNKAIASLRERDYVTCVSDVVSGLQSFPGNLKMTAVGYPCAARIDLSRAEKWLDDLGGPRRADAWSVLAHARHLYERKGYDAALNLLDRLPYTAGTDLAEQREVLGLEILVSTNRLDEAVRFQRGHAPLAVVNLGYALMEAERYGDVVRLLEPTCGELQGRSGHAQCLQYLEYSHSKI